MPQEDVKLPCDFKLLNNEINTLELTDHPDRIFNCDETGWNGKEKSKIKVLAVKGEHAYQQSVLPSSGHITALMCISADEEFYQHSSFSRRLSLTHHTRMAHQETGCSVHQIQDTLILISFLHGSRKSLFLIVVPNDQSF